MIEIEEIDHALALAKDRAKVGWRDEAKDILEQLLEELGDGNLPRLWRASLIVQSGWPIDWDEVRAECLLAVNAEIIRVRIREENEAKGRLRANADRADRAADRMDEVLQVYQTGMSAEQVRRKIIQSGGGSHARRTIQRDLEKIREQEEN